MKLNPPASGVLFISCSNIAYVILLWDSFLAPRTLAISIYSLPSDIKTELIINGIRLFGAMKCRLQLEITKVSAFWYTTTRNI